MNETWNPQLLILNTESTKALTHHGSLPEVHIPKRQRMAPLVISELKRLYGCDALCLCVTENRAYVVMECLEAGPTLQWLELGRLENALQPIVREALTKEGPFAKPGWTSQLGTLVGTIASIEQHNASPYFSLLRFHSQGQDLWFKAVGPPNLREYAVTRALAERCPRFLPHVVATRSEWNGWIMRHEQGCLLEDDVSLGSWTAAVEALADLQLELAGEDRYLLDIGCADCRLDVLAAAAGPFFESVAALMERQPTSPPERLTKSQLKDLSHQIVELCERCTTLGLPNSIIHGDIGQHNVVLSERGPIFIDWAEAYLGQPFCSFERMMAHLRKDYPTHLDWAEPLQSAYASKWVPALPRTSVLEGLALARVLMVYVLAVRLSVMNGGDGDKWTRSMVRRMKRELESFSLREVA